jgi:hypothetical protein
MFNAGMDEMFFTSHYVNGVKEEIKAVVQPQLPIPVDRAALLAKLQQQTLNRSRVKQPRWSQTKTPNPKQDTTQADTASPLWKERQLRDFRKAHDLCYYYGEKFESGHLQKCTKKAKPPINALVVNDVGVELTEDTLNQLVVEGVMAKEMGQLSLNAIARTESGDALRIRALVHNKVMLVLVDSSSSHSFLAAPFLC